MTKKQVVNKKPAKATSTKRVVKKAATGKVSKMADPKKSVWAGSSADPKFCKKDGSWVRSESAFRNFVSDEPGAKYPIEAGRYHLYVSLACPWAVGAYTVMLINGLGSAISASMVAPEWGVVNKEGRRGWVFDPKCTSKVLPKLKCADTVNGKKNMLEVYKVAVPGWTDKVTVPVLWDKKTNTIVNNESSEIMRMLNDQFRKLAPATARGEVVLDLFPKRLQKKVDTLEPWIYHDIQNGVYKCGFAGTQEAYEEAYDKLFAALDKVDKMLSKSTFLLSDEDPSYLDLRLYMCLIRFDPVYVVHFKTNKRTIESYPNIKRWIRLLYHVMGMSMTTDIEHIKRHYFGSHPGLNPKGFVPKGPLPWWE